MLEEFEKGELPLGYESFEILFQWGAEWIAMVVVPMKDANDKKHYVVRLPSNLVIILHLNDWGEWEELKEGETELAKHLGTTIEDYYSLCE